MILHFSIADVMKLLEHSKNAPKHAPNMEQRYSGEFLKEGIEKPKDFDFNIKEEDLDFSKIPPGLWLVGDQGIYLMSNGNPHFHDPAQPDSPEHSFVVYPKECNPKTLPFDEWYYNKREAFGGDDGCEFISQEAIENFFLKKPKSRTFNIDLTPKRMKI
jgi:hypothetical protein